MNSEINKVLPKLRFNEFANEGEWNYINGDELFEPISNKNHNSHLPILAITQEQGAVPRELIEYHVSVTDKSVESYKVVEVGDFIISLRACLNFKYLPVRAYGSILLGSYATTPSFEHFQTFSRGPYRAF